MNAKKGPGGKVCDNAGNCSETCPANQWVKIDRKPPTCTSSGGSQSWTKDDVTIKGTCNDTGGSDCKRATVKREFTGTRNALYSPGTVYDNAGNSADCPNQRVKIDQTPPTFENFQKLNYKWSGGAEGQTWHVKFDITDAHSGVKSRKVHYYDRYQDHTNTSTFNGVFAVAEHIGSGDNKVSYEHTVCDMVGNCKTQRKTVNK